MSPYWNVTAVDAPLLLTVPLSVAPVVVTPVAAAVVAVGGVAGQAAVVNVKSVPFVVPAVLAPTTRKCCSVLHASPVIAADTAAFAAPAANGLCAAVTALP